MTTTTYPKLAALVAEQMGLDAHRVAGLAPGTSFVADLGCDSLDLVELVMALEDELNIEIDDDQAERLHCLRDVVTYLQGRGVTVTQLPVNFTASLPSSQASQADAASTPSITKENTMARTLKINAVTAAILIGLRSLQGVDDTARKAEKKARFAAIRAEFGIPDSVRLKVELDDRSSPDYLVLKDKVTGYTLLADTYGKYAGINYPVAAAPVVEPQPVADTPADTSRFTIVDPDRLLVINKATLMGYLASAVYDDNAQPPTATPPGMPAVKAGSYVLDNQTGNLYFRLPA